MAVSLAIPRRNPVSPPKLPRQRPVANIPHPVEIFLAPVVRNDANFIPLYRGNRGFRQRLHLAEPLRRSPRLHHRLAALANPYSMRVIGDLLQGILRLQILNNLLTCCEPVHARIKPRLSAHMRVIGHHVDFRQAMAPPYLEVIGIVRRRDLHRSSPELAIDHGVGDDRNFAVHQRNNCTAPQQMLEALILRMHRYRRLAQHRFRPRRSHHQKFPAPRHRVLDVPQMSPAFFVQNLQIAQYRLAHRAPVGHALVAID